MREEIKLQEWADRVHDDTYETNISQKKINHRILFRNFFSFRAGLFREKPYPRMLHGEEPFEEPRKLEQLSLRQPNKQQWISHKVCFFSSKKRTT